MAPVEPRALRRIIRHIDEMTAAGYHRDPVVAYRLGVMTPAGLGPCRGGGQRPRGGRGR